LTQPQHLPGAPVPVEAWKLLRYDGYDHAREQRRRRAGLAGERGAMIHSRPLTSADQDLLWAALYWAIHVPQGSEPPSREIVQRPELAHYVAGWGTRPGDYAVGVFDEGEGDGRFCGAAWLRRFTGDEPGYGYVAADTPELSIAVAPGYRGQGLGTRLLAELLAAPAARGPVSLSVSADNPARRLYERFGFRPVGVAGDAVTMLRR
jgi:ribosomal protein S18 acetylase RimI-like enzyme